MLKFVTVEREMPEKRPPNLRREDFGEITVNTRATKAAEQAGGGVCLGTPSSQGPSNPPTIPLPSSTLPPSTSRCSQCGVPYCP